MNQDSESYAARSTHADISLLRKISSNIKGIRDQIIFKLILEVGCTPKEIVELKKEDFEFTTCSMGIGSKDNRRTVKISLELSLQINSLISNDKTNNEHIFSTRQSGTISRRRIAQLVEKNAPLEMKELTPRKLRRISVKAAFARTKSLQKTRAITGIRSLTTKEYLTKEEFDRIREPVRDKRDRLILDIIFEAGCTLGELVNIEVEDIEFARNSLTIRAKEQKREVAISEGLSLRIKEFAMENKLAEKDRLFSTRQSKAISGKRVFQILREYSRNVGLAVNTRILRNTHIAHSLSAGKTIEEVSRQTGIKNLDKFHLYWSLGVGRAGKQHHAEGKNE